LVRHRVVAFTMALAAVTYLDRVCIAVLAPKISADLALSRIEMGYIFSAFAVAYAAFGVPAAWWTDRDGVLRLAAFGVSPGTELGPRPWEVSDLRVTVGERVIVAAPPRYAGRLATALAGAEKAAAVADRYARWGPPPGRYLVYLAGPDEWGRWYGVSQASWVAGYAMPVSDQDTEIILNAQKIDSAAQERR